MKYRRRLHDGPDELLTEIVNFKVPRDTLKRIDMHTHKLSLQTKEAGQYRRMSRSRWLRELVEEALTEEEAKK